MIDINASDALRNVTVTVRVRGMRTLRARMWLGTLLMRLAARVMGVRLDVSAGYTDGDTE